MTPGSQGEAAEPREPPTGGAAGPRWHSARKLLVRFLCIYFGLWLLQYLPLIVPWTFRLTWYVSQIWNRVVPWFGEHVLGVGYTIDPRMTGSSRSPSMPSPPISPFRTGKSERFKRVSTKRRPGNSQARRR